MEAEPERAEAPRRGGVAGVLKMGRRARQDLFAGEKLSTKNSPSASLGEVPPPKPPRRQGGWADDPVQASTKSGRKHAEEIEDHRLRQQSLEASDDGGGLDESREISGKIHRINFKTSTRQLWGAQKFIKASRREIRQTVLGEEFSMWAQQLERRKVIYKQTPEHE
ncbi:intraflagellar transport protein 43 homolog isoform X4 [Zonotrichia leucophrys gambelii]|uniref:intraflagellar transport protein 43 homolog isoform X4 n=1 Tax=Zonotrichia leucophrys gambelii TaxID=257770 RepID=UPI00314031D8